MLTEDLVSSWIIALQAAGKSPHTVNLYREGARQYLLFAGPEAALDRATVRAWLVTLAGSGMAPGTVTARLKAVKQLARWLAEEGEIPVSPLTGMEQPAGDETVVPGITDDELNRLVKACKGTGFIDLRDEAIVRMLAETGIRADELLSQELPDVHLADGYALIHGKGRRERLVPFGPKTAAAVDRYLRRGRKKHRLASTPALWLGGKGPLGYPGLYRTLRLRAEAAGIEGFHPHRLRHTAALRWLDAGGSPQGAQAVLGWSSGKMLDRYIRYDISQRAIRESRELKLGDF